jgi:hypothetical protein
MGYAMRHISQSGAGRWQWRATARGMTLSVIPRAVLGDVDAEE